MVIMATTQKTNVGNRDGAELALDFGFSVGFGYLAAGPLPVLVGSTFGTIGGSMGDLTLALVPVAAIAVLSAGTAILATRALDNLLRRSE